MDCFDAACRSGKARTALLLLGLAVLVAAQPAGAQNIVTNPGFETGNFNGYKLTGSGFTIFTAPGTAHDGSYAAGLGTSKGDGTVTQTLTTSANQLYDISFFLASDGGTPNDFSVTFGGSLLNLVATPPAGGAPFTPTLPATDIPAQPYVQYTTTATAGGTSTDLTFVERDDPGFLRLDDISVTAVPNAAPIPEPAFFQLGGMLAVGGLAFLKRCKRTLA